MKTPLHVFVGEEDGSLTYAPGLEDGPMAARNPFVVTNDFNGDDIPDLAIFDQGVYVGEESLGYGSPPQLFLSSQDGVLRPSSALEDAVRREHELYPEPRYSGADLHIRVATSGDIDNDSDIDLWVESTGGANVNSRDSWAFARTTAQSVWRSEWSPRAGTPGPQDCLRPTTGRSGTLTRCGRQSTI